MADLVKSETDKVLAGVLGGLADAWDVDATALRILYVVLTLVTGVVLGLVIYLLLAVALD